MQADLERAMKLTREEADRYAAAMVGIGAALDESARAFEQFGRVVAEFIGGFNSLLDLSGGELVAFWILRRLLCYEPLDALILLRQLRDPAR